MDFAQQTNMEAHKLAYVYNRYMHKPKCKSGVQGQLGNACRQPVNTPRSSSSQAADMIQCILRPHSERVDYLGQTLTATYVTPPKLIEDAGSASALPSISTLESAHTPYDPYPAPAPMPRPLVVQPWHPRVYKSPQIDAGLPLNATVLDLPSERKLKVPSGSAVKVPSVFATARNSLYSRHSPADWITSNQNNYRTSDRVCGDSERVRRETFRIVNEANDTTQRTQDDVSNKLGARLGNIRFWKTELNQELDNMHAEDEALQRARQELEKALAETENPLRIAKECLYNRENRHGIDFVHDQVEKDLLKEVELVLNCQEEMRSLLFDANKQVTLNRAAQHALEKDSRDKYSAQRLDHTSHELRNTSRGIAYMDNIERSDNCVSVPTTWTRFSNDNLARSQSERAASKDVRSRINVLLNKCCDAMIGQWHRVNHAFTQRCREYTEARQRIQQHLTQVLQEVFDTEKCISLLRKCIQDKVAPLQVAQTRLATRAHRPNMEGCRDPAQHRLVGEVYEINDTVGHLNAQLREAEHALQGLVRSKSTLEQDLSVKNNSLFIDRERCLGLRRTFPMSPRVTCY